MRSIVVRAVAAGLVTGIVCAAAGTLLWLRALAWWAMRKGDGHGGLGAVSLGLGGSALFGLIGFVIGFGYVMWRSR